MPIRWGRMFNDWLLAVLVIGCNLAIRFLFKSIQDDRHLKELESQRLKTELNYLKAQVNPHFFMNTLNNIHALIDIDGERAKETVIELSRIMRYVLYDADRPTVPLRKEMEFIDNYIRLMRIRYAGEVEIRTLCPADPPDVQVPPLMLITLTENAFKHGMSYREGSFIDIRLTVEEGVLSYTVENSVAPDAERGSGVGLENLRKRLGLLYGSAGSLETRNAGGRYTAKLKIPVKR
jgi:LytS/YehU family sensor histidine kinase